MIWSPRLLGLDSSTPRAPARGSWLASRRPAGSPQSPRPRRTRASYPPGFQCSTGPLRRPQKLLCLPKRPIWPKQNLARLDPQRVQSQGCPRIRWLQKKKPGNHHGVPLLTKLKRPASEMAIASLDTSLGPSPRKL